MTKLVYEAWPANGHGSFYRATKDSPDCYSHRTSLAYIQLIFEKDSVKPPILCQCVFNSSPHTLKHNLNICIVTSFPTQMCPFIANTS